MEGGGSSAQEFVDTSVGLDLCTLFGYSYTSHSIVTGAVELTVNWCGGDQAGGGLAPPKSISIRAVKMIKAQGRWLAAVTIPATISMHHCCEE